MQRIAVSIDESPVQRDAILPDKTYLEPNQHTKDGLSKSAAAPTAAALHSAEHLCAPDDNLSEFVADDFGKYFTSSRMSLVCCRRCAFSPVHL